MTKINIYVLILIILFGAFVFVFGGWDDSPGAQLLGLIIAVFGAVGIIRKVKNRNNSAKSK